MLRKLLIRPWFGPLPEWIDRYHSQAARLGRYGFDFLIVNDHESFKVRCREKLGVDVAAVPGTRKASDFCPALGLLFEEELQSYDFWGHADLDCVFGRLDRFVSDDFLAGCDVFGNDPDAICGPFSLYRNSDQTRKLFLDHEDWRTCFEDEQLWGFDEIQFSKTVRASGLRFRSAFWQSHDAQPGHRVPQLQLLDDGTLMDLAANRETMMFHFHLYRKWPLP